MNRKGKPEGREAGKKPEGRKSGRRRLVSGRIKATKKSSYKEHRVDALAPYADEGRGKLRKATGSRKQASIR